MTRFTLPKSHRVPVHEPDESEGTPMPIEPDEGLVSAMVPDDPEHDWRIDPE